MTLTGRTAPLAALLIAATLAATAACSNGAEGGPGKASPTTSTGAASPSASALNSGQPSSPAAPGTPEAKLQAAIGQTVDALPGGVTIHHASQSNESGASVVLCTTVYAQGEPGKLDRASVTADFVADSYADRLGEACEGKSTMRLAEAVLVGEQAWTKPPNLQQYQQVSLTEEGRKMVADMLASDHPWSLLTRPDTRVTASGDDTYVAEIPITTEGESAFTPFDPTTSSDTGFVAGLDKPSFTLRATVTVKDGKITRIETSAPDVGKQAQQNVSIVETIDYGTRKVEAPTDVSDDAPREASSLGELLNVL